MQTITLQIKLTLAVYHRNFCAIRVFHKIAFNLFIINLHNYPTEYTSTESSSEESLLCLPNSISGKTIEDLNG